MIAKIFYSINPHPSEDKWWADHFYRPLHEREDEKPMEVQFTKFNHYWKLMRYQNVAGDDVKVVLEKLFALYNDAGSEPNPLSSDEGQNRVRASGTHHTSMSVGDVVYLKGKYWIVAGVGFKELKVR